MECEKQFDKKVKNQILDIIETLPFAIEIEDEALVLTKLQYLIKKLISQAIEEERKRIEGIIDKWSEYYYGWNDGCGCCSDEESFNLKNVKELLSKIKKEKIN